MTKPRILVIEDEPSIAENLEYSLRTEGFDVEVCALGEEGLSSARRDPPSLVVLDVGLPDTSGFEVCRQLRQTSAVPVLFLTARESEIDRVAGLEMGGDDYVTKPFSPRELAARVRAILRRADPPPVAREEPLATPTQVVDGVLEIDLQRREVTFHGQNVPLTRYEFGLLQAMAAHPGRVFTREQLMDRVWEEPETAMERTVDAHVKTLRAKLREVDPSCDPFVTHRGIGYSLRDHFRNHPRP